MMRRILHSSSLSFILMSRVRALLTISSQDASSYPSQDSSNTAPDKTAEIISGPRSRTSGLVLRVLCSLYVNLFILLVAPLASRLGGSTRAADCLQVRRRCAYADVSVRPSVCPSFCCSHFLINCCDCGGEVKASFVRATKAEQHSSEDGRTGGRTDEGERGREAVRPRFLPIRVFHLSPASHTLSPVAINYYQPPLPPPHIEVLLQH